MSQANNGPFTWGQKMGHIMCAELKNVTAGEWENTRKRVEMMEPELAEVSKAVREWRTYGKVIVAVVVVLQGAIVTKLALPDSNEKTLIKISERLDHQAHRLDAHAKATDNHSRDGVLHVPYERAAEKFVPRKEMESLINNQNAARKSACVLIPKEISRDK